MPCAGWVRLSARPAKSAPPSTPRCAPSPAPGRPWAQPRAGSAPERASAPAGRDARDHAWERCRREPARPPLRRPAHWRAQLAAAGSCATATRAAPGGGRARLARSAHAARCSAAACRRTRAACASGGASRGCAGCAPPPLRTAARWPAGGEHGRRDRAEGRRPRRARRVWHPAALAAGGCHLRRLRAVQHGQGAAPAVAPRRAGRRLGRLCGSWRRPRRVSRCARSPPPAAAPGEHVRGADPHGRRVRLERRGEGACQARVARDKRRSAALQYRTLDGRALLAPRRKCARGPTGAAPRASAAAAAAPLRDAAWSCAWGELETPCAASSRLPPHRLL